MKSLKIKSFAIILLIALSFSLFVPIIVSAEDDAVVAEEVAAAVENADTEDKTDNNSASDDICKIVSLGDSIPAHDGIGEDQGCIAQLSKLLASKKVNNEIVNLAKSGSTATDIITLLETDKAKAALKDADVVTLSVGSSDILTPLLKYIWAITAMVKQDFYTGIDSPAIGNFYFTANRTANLQFDVGGSNYASLSIAALEKAFELGMTDEAVGVIALAIEAFATDFYEIVAQIIELAPDATIYVSTVYNPVSENVAIYEYFAPILEVMNIVIIAGAQDDSYRVIDVASAFATSDRNLTGFDIVRRMYNILPNRFGHIEIAKLYCDAMTGNYVKPILDIPTETPVEEAADEAEAVAVEETVDEVEAVTVEEPVAEVEAPVEAPVEAIEVVE